MTKAEQANLRSKISKRFRERNRRFLKLTRAQQRIKILRDVISDLNTNKLKAFTGIYIRVSKPIKYDEVKDKQLHEVLAQQSSCTVCGIGGLFVSAVSLEDKIKVKEVKNYSDYFGNINLSNCDYTSRSYLTKWFSKYQLDLIEAAFETDASFANETSSAIAAEEFGDRYNSPKKRLIAICENMIRNGGIFRPNK